MSHRVYSQVSPNDEPPKGWLYRCMSECQKTRMERLKNNTLGNRKVIEEDCSDSCGTISMVVGIFTNEQVNGLIDKVLSSTDYLKKIK